MSPRILFWRSFYFLVNPFRRVYWHVVRPKTRGVKCLIERNGKFLLVKLAYAHKQWTLPGGKVNNKETFEDAAWRELHEETNVRPQNLTVIGEYESRREGKRDTVRCFYGQAESSSFIVDPLEIAEAGWYARIDFPINRGERVDQIVALYDKSLHI